MCGEAFLASNCSVSLFHCHSVSLPLCVSVSLCLSVFPRDALKEEIRLLERKKHLQAEFRQHAEIKVTPRPGIEPGTFRSSV